MNTETTTTDPREDKLPKWARDEFESLRRRVRDAEKLAEQARLDTDPGGSDTLLQRGLDDPIGLGNGASIRFVVDAARRHFIDARLVDGRLDLNVPNGQVGVLPRAANAALIQHVER